ncbi:hypothetical protein PAPHI01_0456 [Pancytospora philotis]|nr:hypothetical protein PAPHI01_0456 [Pancytospora philotis]
MIVVSAQQRDGTHPKSRRCSVTVVDRGAAGDGKQKGRTQNTLLQDAQTALAKNAGQRQLLESRISAPGQSEERVVLLLETYIEEICACYTEKISGFTAKAKRQLIAAAMGGEYAGGRILEALELCSGLGIRATIGTRRIPKKTAGGMPVAAACAPRLSAMSLVGRCYEFGLLGLPQNAGAAVYAYKQAAREGCPSGTYHYARCLEHGLGTPRDAERASQFYRCSYKLGHLRGTHRYAQILLWGNAFVGQDLDLGLHALKQAVAGSGAAYSLPYFDLGMIYRSKCVQLLPDPRYSFKVLLRGATLGCTRCQYQVSLDYEAGQSTEKDLEKSFLWCKTAAEQGHTDARYKLACVLIKLASAADDYGSFGAAGMEAIAASARTAVKNINELESQAADGGATNRMYLAGGRGKGAAPQSYKEPRNSIFDHNEIYFASEMLQLNVNKFYSAGTDLRAIGLRMAEAAAAAGHLKAVMLVARVLESEDSTGRNLPLCLWYYSIAEALGCKEAAYKVVSIEAGLGIKRDEKKCTYSSLFSIPLRFLMNKP